MAAFVDVLGPALHSKDDELQTAEALDGKSAVGLYFVAPEAPACEEFTAKLLEAYNGDLQQKGLEIVLVSPTIPIEGVADEFEPTKYPWLVLMFDDEEGHLEFVKKFEVQEFPKLVFLDPEAQVATADGIARVTEDPAGEGFPWNDNDPKMLTEDEILIRLGPSPPEPGLDGLKGIFINNKKHEKLGLVDSLDEDESIPFSGMNPRPYVELDCAEILAEVQKIGFASDFHKHRQAIEKLEKSGGDKLLMFYDPDKTYGDKFTYVTSVPAYKREKERIEAARQEIIDAHLATLKKSTGGGEGGVEAAEDDDDQDIVVRDGPKYGKEWVSEHMAKTHEEVRKFTLEKRSLLQVMITRTRQHFGKQVKFSDGPENVASCRPSKEPNFGVKRKELEIGIQAVKETADASCQTAWFRPVNKSTQYLPKHFLDELSTDHGWNQIKELTDFLQSVSDSVEEALQTNETVDIFREEFAHLGEDDSGAVSKTHSNIKELLFFYDVKFTKNKRIEWVEWVPGTTDVDMIACSCCDNQTFYEKVDTCGKVFEKTILIWSIQNALLPHSILLSPWDVPVFKFWPTDYHYVVGGLSSGQLAVWKVSDADLGLAHREKRGSGQDEEKGQAIPSTSHKQISVIDDSHKRAILAIEWLPASIEIVRRGKGAQDTNPKDGPRKYFVTLACDGQLMIWDFGALLESINDNDTPWKPIHRIQLQRQDSGTEMGCCHLLYCDDKVDEKGNKMLTNFYASTEEGEILFGDWAARTEEDRKPEFCKKMFPVSKTFRPMLSFVRSPFFPDILLGVTDWAFYFWKESMLNEGYKEPLFQSAYTQTTSTSCCRYFTCGAWSPTRPSVVFLGLVSGSIDIWDLSDQSHKASLIENTSSIPITSMVFQPHGDLMTEQKLAVGDVGNLHIYIIPKNLVKQAGREYDNMKKFLEREEARVKYFHERREKLEALVNAQDRQNQTAADTDQADTKGKTVEDSDKLDAHLEDVYQKLEAECLELLKQQGSGY